jgi:CheY-like chemotaxis protein
MQVLVVDDNATNRLILQETVSSWAMEVVSVDSGAKALEVLYESARTDAPVQLVLTDLNMPHMDGFTLCDKIRSTPQLDNVVILMLTSGSRLGDQAHCDELGISAHLMKPVKQSELLKAILAAVASKEDQGSLAEPSSESISAQRPLRILVAEDGVANQKLIVGLLSRWGHSVTLAGDGREAIEAWKSNTFDLVLMDVQMPNLDGLQATRLIRDREQRKGGHIRIIAMTAHAMEGDRQRCLDAGMDGYLSKPVRMQELFDVLEGQDSHVPGSDEVPPPTARSEPVQEQSAGMTEASPPPTEQPSVDSSAALEAVGGDEELLKDIVDECLRECPALMEQLRQAIDDRDAARAHRMAHTLKGNMRIFQARPAADLALQIEAMAGEGSLEGVAAIFSQLQEAVIQLKPMIAALGKRNEG